MLENIDLQKELDKETYKKRMDDLSERLYYVQRKTWEAGIPVIIVFEGWDAAGKGTTIHKLTDPIDPRGYKIYPIRAARTYEKKRPWLWRFWLKVPARGEWAIFDRSWYGRVLVERMLHLTPKAEWKRAYRDIIDFEQTLADDGALILKFFLHISKKEQAKRFHKLERDPLNAWRVTAEDWSNHKRYASWLLVYEEMLERTDSEWAPWTIVEATDKRFTRVKVYQTIIDALEERLGIQPGAQTAVAEEPEGAEKPAEEQPAMTDHLEIIEQAEPQVQESPLDVAEKADEGVPVEGESKGASADSSEPANQPTSQAVPEDALLDANPEPAPEPPVTEETDWQLEEAGLPPEDTGLAESDHPPFENEEDGDDDSQTEDNHAR